MGMSVLKAVEEWTVCGSDDWMSEEPAVFANFSESDPDRGVGRCAVGRGGWRTRLC